MDLTIDLKLKLELHAKWLRGESDGERLDLVGKDLRNANLVRANLRNANLRNANLVRANLRNANLVRANLRNADLEDANLENANLENANLEDANLRNANLRNADLEDANLVRANLENANLDNLDFSVWPLWCGSFGAKASKRLFAQLVKHAAMLNVSDCDEETRSAMSALRKMPCASWFDQFRGDLAKTPETEQGEE